MYPDIPIVLALAFVAAGLYVLAWSADRFVEGADAVARAIGVSPFCSLRTASSTGREMRLQMPKAPKRHRAAIRALRLRAGLRCSLHRRIFSSGGAVGLARSFGVSELLIGLTVIAAGTSLPELASAIASARRGQNELTLGNIIGSNFFNALAVVGTSGAISPP